jgi:TPR repeat protein
MRIKTSLTLILTTALASGAVLADGPDSVVLEDMRGRAEQGDPFAQTELGFLYRNGFGVTQDESQALTWYEEAAKTGFVLALLGLGEIYAEPLGAHSDVARAIMMYSLAAKQGIGVAAERESNLRNSADAADLVEADRLIEAWRMEPAGRPYRMPQPTAR